MEVTVLTLGANMTTNTNVGFRENMFTQMNQNELIPLKKKKTF